MLNNLATLFEKEEELSEYFKTQEELFKKLFDLPMLSEAILNTKNLSSSEEIKLFKQFIIGMFYVLTNKDSNVKEPTLPEQDLINPPEGYQISKFMRIQISRMFLPKYTIYRDKRNNRFRIHLISKYCRLLLISLYDENQKNIT